MKLLTICALACASALRPVKALKAVPSKVRNLLKPQKAAAPAAAPPSLKPYLSQLIDGDDLSFDDARGLFGAFLDGSASSEQVAGVLCTLRQKGETPDEIAGAATAMRDACVRVETAGTLLDIVGTGGDGACTINLSTCSAILAAACGAKVTKCGNRSVSSACGAADVLEALGLDLELDLADVTRCIDDVGLGFLYAPKNHPAMRFVAPVRRALGVRTAFNLLGPLTNAAGAQRVVIGVFEEKLVDLLAGALERIGVVEHAVVIHGVGLDELSPLGPCTVRELKKSGAGYESKTWTLEPLDYGLPRCTLADLVGGGPEFNQRALRRVLAADPESVPLGEETTLVDAACRDAVALNAGMGLYVYGAADSVAAGVKLAQEGLASGAGLAKLDEWIAASKAYK
mmetsp:Transcript_7739/g.22992  ORF Transcript_7739/g.22992 Transcript_7739/m.22992 type:complete len:400 (+) Transcript_7739:126-1325(+)